MYLLKRLLVLLSLCMCLWAANDYCEVRQATSKAFIVSGETQYLPLDSYVAGFDLAFTFENAPQSAELLDPCHVSDTQQTPFTQYPILNSDVLKDQLGNWQGIGVLFGQKNTSSVMLAKGFFTGEASLPPMTATMYTLPEPMKCFDARVVNKNGDVILSCQAIDTSYEWVCFISAATSALECSNFPTAVVATWRKSAIIQLGKNIFLLSASKRDRISVITVYNLNSGKAQFNTVIDAAQLGLDSLLIVDFGIDSSGNLLIADGSADSPRLAVVRLDAVNPPMLLKVVALGSVPMAVHCTSIGTLFVATGSRIWEHRQNDFAVVNSYEVDQSDNEFLQVQANANFLAVRSSKNLFIYDRGQSSLKLLLQRILLPQASFLVSPYFSVMYKFTQSSNDLIAVSKGYLLLADVSESSESQKIDLLAKSGTTECRVSFTVSMTDQYGPIAVKEQIDGRNFKIESSNEFIIKLNDYFGGPSLTYRSPAGGTINHVNKYTIESTTSEKRSHKQDPILFQEIVTIDSNSYYQVSATSSLLLVGLCQLSNASIVCQRNSIPLQSKPQALTARKCSNGKYYAAWTFERNTFESVELSVLKLSSVTFGQPYGLSSIILSDSMIYLTSKMGNFIAIFSFPQLVKVAYLDESNLPASDVARIGGFYPREIILDTTTDKMVYVKLVKSICAMAIMPDSTLQLVSVWNILDKYIPSENWGFIVGRSTLLTILPNSLVEYSRFGNSMLKTIKLDTSVLPFSFRYDPYTDSVFLSTLDLIITLKLNVAQIDTYYYTINRAQMAKRSLTSENSEHPNEIQSQFVSSGNWLIVPEYQTAFFIHKDPILSFSLTIPDDKDTEDVDLKISVSNVDQVVESNTKITVVNYPLSIKDNGDEKGQLTLPSNASNIQFPIKLDTFFTGPVSSFSIKCDYCKDKITLRTPFGVGTQVPSLGGALDYATYSSALTIALDSDSLYLLNGSTVLATEKLSQASCQKLDYSEALGLLVFCSTMTDQMFLQYTIDSGTNFQLNKMLPIQFEATITKMDNFRGAAIEDNNYILVLDNDNTIDTEDKTSIIHLFLVKDFAVQFVAQINSIWFKSPTVLPINSMDFMQDVLIVTIGNYGIGYAQIGGDNLLQNLQTVNLKDEPSIQSQSLDDSSYKTVKVLSVSQDIIKLLLTTTSSLHFVVNFKLANNILSFAGVTESYYRYGTLQLLSWASMTKDSFFASYYNPSRKQVQLVRYPRVEGKATYFHDSIVLAAMITQQAAILSGNTLFASAFGQDGNWTMVYTLSDHFALWLDYAVPGSFTGIDINATNEYSTAMHSQMVKFEGSQDSSGLRWYVIVIVAAVVLIVVGALFGLYLYMKSRKAQKNVSLLTENEEVDQEV